MSWTYSNEHMKPLYLGLSFTFFFLRHDRSSRTQPSFGGVRVAWNKSQKLFRAKSYVIRTLLLCDWSVQQSANKPQTQKEKKVVSCEQPFLWGEHCGISQKTAAEETSRPGEVKWSWWIVSVPIFSQLCEWEKHVPCLNCTSDLKVTYLFVAFEWD